MAVTAPSKIKVPETTVASPAGVPRAYNFNDFGCPASAKASFDLQRQFPKLSSLPKAPGPDAAFKSAVRGCQASSRARKHRPVHFMRSALAQLVKEAAMRRCKPKHYWREELAHPEKARGRRYERRPLKNFQTLHRRKYPHRVGFARPAKARCGRVGVDNNIIFCGVAVMLATTNAARAD